jgi:hypothetical protein
MKIQLKIKKIMWFLHRKVILTKDNLIKRRWTGVSKRAFCDGEETVEHLFIRCPFFKLVWQVVHFMFNIPPPATLKNYLDDGSMVLIKKRKNGFE